MKVFNLSLLLYLSSYLFYSCIPFSTSETNLVFGNRLINPTDCVGRGICHLVQTEEAESNATNRVPIALSLSSDTTLVILIDKSKISAEQTTIQFGKERFPVHMDYILPNEISAHLKTEDDRNIALKSGLYSVQKKDGQFKIEVALKYID